MPLADETYSANESAADKRAATDSLRLFPGLAPFLSGVPLGHVAFIAINGHERRSVDVTDVSGCAEFLDRNNHLAIYLAVRMPTSLLDNTKIESTGDSIDGCWETVSTSHSWTIFSMVAEHV